MQHPFALELSDLEALNAGIEEELTGSEAEKISGGSKLTTLALGEEGGSDITTLALCEEGGCDVTTLAVGEEGGGCYTNVY